MSGQLWFVLGVGVLAGLGAGVPLGHWRGRRVGLEDGYDQGCAASAFDANLIREEAYHDGWQDGCRERREPDPPPAMVGHTTYPELVALAQEYDELSNPPADHQLRAAYPSPYTGPRTPAQRRRDKHKQRGDYAPAPGWTADPDHITAAHWKPEGDRWMAEWRIEWQDDVAAVDEEIAEWTARQRAWLAADRWDRGARRLGAVA